MLRTLLLIIVTVKIHDSTNKIGTFSAFYECVVVLLKLIKLWQFLTICKLQSARDIALLPVTLFFTELTVNLVSSYQACCLRWIIMAAWLIAAFCESSKLLEKRDDYITVVTNNYCNNLTFNLSWKDKKYQMCFAFATLFWPWI